MERRVVITGIGVVAPGAVGTGAFWEFITSGRTATRLISLFDASGFRSRIAAEVDFDPLAAGLASGDTERLDRAAQFAVVCARAALADSGLEASRMDPYRVGVTLGTAVGATMSLDREYSVVSDSGQLWLVDPDKALPYLYDYFVPSSFAAEVGWAVGAQGPAAVVSTGCTSGIDSVAHACELIREGSADVMITGATDAPISPITLACFDAIKATTPYNDSPATASRPFDASRAGFVLAEGAAIMVIEDLAAARARGAQVYAAVTGYATRLNAYHMTGLKADGREMAEAIRIALDQSRLDPTGIGYVNAHGSGTKQNDRHETAAYKRSLGQHAYAVPISSIKSMVGHSLGAIGSIELAASALALRDNCVPPTANLTTKDEECDLDYVPRTAREVKLDAVLSVGSGFGGFQSAMVLQSPDAVAA